MRLEKHLIVILILSLAGPANVLSEEKKAQAAKVEFSPDAVEKNIAAKPAFSRDSSDQAQVEASLEKNQEHFEELSFGHLEKLQECGKQKSIEAIERCKNDYLTIKKK